MARDRLVKATGIVAFFTVVGKVLGFVREASLAAVFGTTAATDSLLVAETLPTLFFAVISYGITTAYIPIYTQVRMERGQEAAWGFARNILTALLIVGVIIVVFGTTLSEQLVRIVAPGFSKQMISQTGTLTRLIFPIAVFQLLSGVFTGILQSENSFALPAMAALVQNVSIIIGVLVFGSSQGIGAVAVSIVVGTGLAVSVKVIAVYRLGFRWWWRLDLTDPDLNRMRLLMIPALVGAGATQLNTMIDRMLASGLSEGSIAALNYANMIMELAPGVLGVSIVTVVFPTLAKMSAREQWGSLSDAVLRTLSLMNFLLAPIAVAVLVLREPLVRIVFERGVFDSAATKETSWALLFLSMGITIFSLRRLMDRAFFAMQDTRTPMALGLMTVVLNIVLNLIFVGPLGHGGLALGTTLSGLVGLILSVILFGRRCPAGIDHRPLLLGLLRVMVASGVMGLGIRVLYPLVQSWVGSIVVIGLLELLITVVVGAVIYIGVSWLLRASEVREIWNHASRIMTLRFGTRQ